jgi:hypothetical protein
MHGVRAFGGGCLVAAAVTFWLAWLLMPMPGTTDVAYILENVAATPERVWLSVGVQMLSSALFVPGLLAFVASPALRDSTLAFAAATLAGIGVTGLAADAIYHLLAYEMVQPGISREAMLPLMARFQREDLVFVAPQLLALVLGAGSMSLAAMRAGTVSKLNPALYAVALGVSIAGGTLASALGQGRRVVALVVLAIVSAAIAWLGVALARDSSADR